MRTLALTAACLLLGSACGGDDGDAEAFRAEASGICADFEEKIAMIPPPAEDPDEWAAIAADIGDLLETGVNQLDALEPPDDLGERYDEWLALKQESLSATRDLQEAGAAVDEERIAGALRRIEESERQADEIADELGLAECASSG